MKFATHNENPAIDPIGTCLQGYLTCDYSVLAEVFGEPERYDLEDKVQASWNIEFSDRTIATIYSWKNYGVNPEVVREWNVGGRSQKALSNIRQAIADFYRERVAS